MSMMISVWAVFKQITNKSLVISYYKHSVLHVLPEISVIKQHTDLLRRIKILLFPERNWFLSAVMIIVFFDRNAFLKMG